VKKLHFKLHFSYFYHTQIFMSQNINLLMKNQKCLIVLTDDDKEEHVLFKEVADEFDEIYSIISFEKGLDLLKYLNNPAENFPDIIFLDLNMPTISGFECLSKIRSTRELDGLKVVIYSTSASEKDVKVTFENGANLYITKPNNFYNMKEMLEKVLKTDWQKLSKERNIQDYKLNITC
jgi:CheY-like chemotaxis protein